jgi:hypothetical protein
MVHIYIDTMYITIYTYISLYIILHISPEKWTGRNLDWLPLAASAWIGFRSKIHGFLPSAPVCFFHHPILGSHPNLVGGLNPSEKYESVGTIIPNIWKNKKCSKPPTRNW